MFADSCRKVATQGEACCTCGGKNVLPLYLSAGIQHDMCEQDDAIKFEIKCMHFGRGKSLSPPVIITSCLHRARRYRYPTVLGKMGRGVLIMMLVFKGRVVVITGNNPSRPTMEYIMQCP